MAFPLLLRARRAIVKAAISAVGVGDWFSSGIFRSSGELWPGQWQSGTVIECTENLFRFSSVYACIALISGDIAKLPPRLMRWGENGIWSEVLRESPFLALIRKPNRYQTWAQFTQQWVSSKLIHGNAYVYIERDGRRFPRALYVIDPRYVMPSEAPDGEVFYQIKRWRLAGLPEGAALVPASEIIHDRMMPIWHPLIGVSPLYASGVAATVGLRIQKNSERLFNNMSRPFGQLTSPATLTQQTVDRLKKEFEENFSGDRIGRLFVAGQGLKFETITMPAQDSQLAEQHKISIEEVARAFHVPLYKISAGQYPNLTSVGAINQDYYNHALQIHLQGIEQCLDAAFGLDGLGLKIDIDENALMRMDPLGRAEVTDKQIHAGVLSPNEARARDNRQPVTGGDSPYLQQQNYSLAALAKRDAKDDPFGTSSSSAPAEGSEITEPEEDDEEEEMEMGFESAIRKFEESPGARPI